MLDHYIWGDATRISPEAPVPVVHVNKDTHTLGGAANVALNLKAFGAGKVSLLGCFANDSNGLMLTGLLEAKGIGYDERFALNTARTITKTRVVVRNQQLCRLDVEDSPRHYMEHFNAKLDVIEEYVQAADAIILSDYCKGVISQSLLNYIIPLAKKYNKFIALDPKPKHKLDFPNLDLLTPNKSEAADLAGLAYDYDHSFDVERVVASIFEKYQPKNLVITMGAEGMVLASSAKSICRIPTFAREVYDVSGAGDTAAAALVLGLVAGFDLNTSASFSNICAGVVVSKVGTATASPEEILNWDY